MCVICVQEIASCLEDLKNPSISEGWRERLEGAMEYCKEAMQEHRAKIESYDSALRGESCPRS